MMLWELQWNDRDAGTYGIYCPDSALASEARGNGVSTLRVREVFSRGGRDEVCFQLVAEDHLTVIKTQVATIADLQFWAHPIFSDRAMRFLCSLGCRDDEFFRCRFEGNSGDFFMHLPLTGWDIVDIEKSSFAAILPGVPPLPFRIESLVTKDLPPRLPPCFRAPIPGHLQIFPEVFATEDMKVAWEGSGFIGAKFRALTAEAVTKV